MESGYVIGVISKYGFRASVCIVGFTNFVKYNYNPFMSTLITWVGERVKYYEKYWFKIKQQIYYRSS